MDYIFIDDSGQERQLGFMEDSRLVEFYIEGAGQEEIVGNIYRARVLNVVEGINAAFLDIGGDKNAYLMGRDALGLEDLYRPDKPSISKVLKPGQELIVQVKKEALGQKGATVSRHYELNGKNLVLTPFSNRVNISRKIKGSQERKRLEEIGQDLIRDDVGLIFRTNAFQVDPEELRQEYRQLFKVYSYIEGQKNFLPTPKLLYSSVNNTERLIRDKYRPGMTILVNRKSSYGEVGDILEAYGYEREKDLVLDRDFSLKYRMDIWQEINRALSRKVQLDSGASIVIDRTEALTAIDVNTESYTGRASLSKTVYRVNCEAAVEIARQIRLRNISGIIVIDFIRMRDSKKEEKLIGLLKEELKKDNIHSSVVGFTKLGLLEMTREKKSNSIYEDFLVECENCRGLGKIRK